MFELAKLPLLARLKTHPAIFLPVARLRNNAKREVVRRDTDVVIEGFWRCGNHFATYAFIVAQRERPMVAHHFHAPAQLMIAARWGVPAILLIREPVETVASSTVYFEQNDPGLWLRLYNIFHAPLVAYANRLVVSDFEQTTNDFGRVIAAVNAKYGRQFELFDGSAEQRAQVEQRIRDEHSENMGAKAARLPLPSAEKAQRKKQVIERLHSAEYASLLAESQRLYSALKTNSVGSLSAANSLQASAS